MKALLIIPTYNESGNIAPLLKAIFAHVENDVSVLFVDDSSSDGTLDEIKQARKQYGEKTIHYQVRAGKMGLGSAYVDGLNWGLSKGYKYFIQMDADLSHPASALPVMIKELQEHQLVIGSRYVAGGGVENWSLFRQLISRLGSIYARLVLSVSIRDFTGGFNAWSRDVVEAISIDTIKSEGYSFQIEMKYRASMNGFKIKEIPIVFVDRIQGTSKMSLGIAIEALWRILTFRYGKR